LTFSTKETLKSFKTGEPGKHKNVTVFPLFSPLKEVTAYKTLNQALKEDLIRISEVEHGGNVPDIPVLILDGEELMGAKQNRVLNTTVLLEVNSKTVVPVSCTEQGRWSYNSDHFADSGVVMNSSARRSKNYYVSESLNDEGTFDSHQGEVWYEIHRMSSKRGVKSETPAMRDVFEKSRHELENYLETFILHEGQRGILVFINEKIAGLDYVSSPRAFTDLYPKLLKSYIMDALVEKGKNGSPVDPGDAGKFVNSIAEADESSHPSISLGEDHRYKGRDLLASALVHKEELIHLAAFPVEGNRFSINRKEQYFSDYARRKGFRRSNGNIQ